MPKTTKRTQTSGKEIAKKGKKGGISVVPATVGAMAGAAIGGIAGLALGSETARHRLALAKDKALETAGGILDNLEAQTHDVQEEADKLADSALGRATEVKKSVSGKAKSTKSKK